MDQQKQPPQNAMMCCVCAGTENTFFIEEDELADHLQDVLGSFICEDCAVQAWLDW